MRNTFFHNNKLIETVKDLDLSHTLFAHKKNTVDINKLLNRVKVNEKKKKNLKAMYFLTTVLSLFIVGFFLTI